MRISDWSSDVCSSDLELEHAKARGAKIYGEVAAYAATSDGADMVAPSGEGAVRCMRLAMKSLGNTPVEYINAHGTSTPVGDITELKAIREACGADMPRVTYTQSLSGHFKGATGEHEAIYPPILVDNNF